MRVILIPLILLLGGCAQTLPEDIRQGPVNNPGLAEVLQSFDYYQGVDVRWGGEIVSLRQRVDDSLIEVEARPLDRFGTPLAGDQLLGRFFVRVDTGIEPSAYESGRMLTVAGVLEGLHQEQVGERTVTYPVVSGRTLKLWQHAARQEPYWRAYHRWGFHHPYPPLWIRFGHYPHPFFWHYQPYFWY